MSATLPPSAHLNILLNLVTAHPELGAEILDKLPQPELNECLHQLEKQLEKIKRGVGLSTIQLNPDRVWTRVHKEVEAYTRIVSCRSSQHFATCLAAAPLTTRHQHTSPL